VFLLWENFMPAAASPEAGNKLPAAYRAAVFPPILRLMISALKRELN